MAIWSHRLYASYDDHVYWDEYYERVTKTRQIHLQWVTTSPPRPWIDETILTSDTYIITCTPTPPFSNLSTASSHPYHHYLYHPKLDAGVYIHTIMQSHQSHYSRLCIHTMSRVRRARRELERMANGPPAMGTRSRLAAKPCSVVKATPPPPPPPPPPPNDLPPQKRKYSLLQ
ncbi:hypothetical protein G6011_09517 [Alternaria panax]|uniref:Uncharacterized protein n=1 Tax=Alternaria panax TaxID=48097 RepID=A0AAD4IBE8_9PLEO|nr:hypothetical protein G6011_09517 [Alternaria panax]